ncbi:unnamed protein product [Cyprideis torosa]|uniref:Uncharacterized protein n=1 Tax=Cyprideis torosa TaxID=163714 RepID=A0A7R8WTP4_9CRUS|nr:unnamed protein product [Cyprideis torosa]CAG0906281.1 unnamed protein product [Cyprideis torosa]
MLAFIVFAAAVVIVQSETDKLVLPLLTDPTTNLEKTCLYCMNVEYYYVYLIVFLCVFHELDNNNLGPLVSRTDAMVPAQDSKCPTGFFSLFAGCYAVVTTRKTFDQAQTDCASRAKGGRLVEFENGGEYYLLKAYLIYNAKRCLAYWIGAVEIGDTNIYKWETSGAPVSFYEWIAGQPNLISAHNAICMYCWEDWKWNDRAKSSTLFYICEADPAA